MPAMGERAEWRSNLREMMSCLDIDPAGAILPDHSLSYFTVLRRCEFCACKDTCRDWLAHRSAAASTPPSFCPNADILFELQFDQLHHSPDARGLSLG